MSIATRTGDHGTTSLMFNRRVGKGEIRIEANGALDELNAAIGLARAFAPDAWVCEALFKVQERLVSAMGEIAVLPEDLERYKAAGYGLLQQADTEMLDDVVMELEQNRKISFKHWATPGATRESATLDVARTVCRRAEREVLKLGETGVPLNEQLLPFLNRLSDVLWLLARYVETSLGQG